MATAFNGYFTLKKNSGTGVFRNFAKNFHKVSGAASF